MIRLYDQKVSLSTERAGRHNTSYQEESVCSVEHVVRHFQVGQRFVPIVVQQLPITSPARRYREPNPPDHHSISPTTSLSLPTTRPSSLLNQGKPASHRQFMEDHPMTHQQRITMLLLPHLHSILTVLHTHQLLVLLYRQVNHLAVKAPRLA